MPEGFEGQVTESQVSVPPVEEAPISSTATPQKRKAFGPSREYDLPPRKKGGRRGKMTQAEQESRKRTEKLGTCITCRRRGKKVSDLRHKLLFSHCLSFAKGKKLLTLSLAV